MTATPVTLDSSLAAEIAAAVRDGFSTQVAHTADLVRFASTRGDEHAIQDFVFQDWRRQGYAMERFAMDGDALGRHPGGTPMTAEHSTAPIVVAIHRPREETGRTLILQAHVDVVPAGPANLWQSRPFEPLVQDGWMHGRGAGDMKAGHAANSYALKALRSLGLQPAATVTLQSVVEEESTGNGALMTHIRGYRADAVLIPEPEDEKLVRANTGVIWFTVEVSGHPVHVREMGDGANAIDAAYRVVGALRELESRWNEAKTKLADDVRPHFEHVAHPINLNIGRIEGGDWASSVPAWCRLHCRISLYPGVAAAEAAREIQDAVVRFSRVDPYLANNPPKVDFNGFFAEGYVLQPGSAAEAVLGRAHQTATGQQLESFMTAGYLDTRVHALYDRVPALCYGPISRNIHGFDEAVDLASLARITTAMALFVAEWCGVERVQK